MAFAVFLISGSNSYKNSSKSPPLSNELDISQYSMKHLLHVHPEWECKWGCDSLGMGM